MTHDTHALARVLQRCAIEDRGYMTPCWISDRARQPNGYTKIGVKGKTCLTHRVAYDAEHGVIEAGLVLDHLCRNRECANPAHLEPVTNRVNLLRGEGFVARQTAKTHCVRGHEFTDVNTYRRKDHPHKRECLTCRNTARHRRPAGATPKAA